MSTYIHWELMLFLRAAFLGALLLSGYDVLRILRQVFPHPRWMVAFEDFIYWVSLGFFVFAKIYHLNQGSIRSFFILGLLLGAWMCHRMVSSFFVKTGTRILMLPGFFLKKMIKRLLFPVRRGKIFLYRIRNKTGSGRKKKISQIQKGKHIEKIKKSSKQKENNQ